MLVVTNDNSKFTVNNDIFCQNINCNTLDVSNIELSGGDIYVGANQSYMPVGIITIYAGQTVPSGWLLCDGNAINRDVYSRLFSVISTLYGSGDGSTTFNLPNLQERLPVGKSTSTNLGSLGGNDRITLTTDQMPQHSHTGTTLSNGSHTHTGNTTQNGSHIHTSNATGGLAQPGLAFSNGQNTTTGLDSDGLNELNLKNTVGLTINENGNHLHSLNVTVNGSHTHTFTTDVTGNNESIDIRNKYIVINYIIRY